MHDTYMSFIYVSVNIINNLTKKRTIKCEKQYGDYIFDGLVSEQLNSRPAGGNNIVMVLCDFSVFQCQDHRLHIKNGHLFAKKS